MHLSVTNLNSVEKMYDFYHKDRRCIPTDNVFEERRNALYWYVSKVYTPGSILNSERLSSQYLVGHKTCKKYGGCTYDNYVSEQL